jgi:acyl carrier protein
LALLAPGGFLILSEVTRDLAWYDVTTGLIEGWQRFEDAWRTDSPLLAPEQWKAILQSQGFEKSEVMPTAGSIAEVLGQHVIIARTPLGLNRSQEALGPVHSVDSIPAKTPTRFRTATESSVESQNTSGQFLKRLTEAAREEQHELLVDFVQRQVAGVLKIDSDHLPSRKGRLLDLGLDSLLAVELRNRLNNVLHLKRKLPATLVFDYPTVEAIAGFLEHEFLDSPESAKPEFDQVKEPIMGEPTTAEKVAQMSDEQVEQMLLERLKRRKETQE